MWRGGDTVGSRIGRFSSTTAHSPFTGSIIGRYSSIASIAAGGADGEIKPSSDPMFLGLS